MTIIVEDGTGDLLATANSYVTVAELQDFAELRGITDVQDDDKAEQCLLKAVDYLETLEIRFSGSRTYVDQVMPFPRQSLIVNGDIILKNTIPWQVKKAQMLVAILVAQGVNLMPIVTPSTNLQLKRKKIGPIEREWFAPNDPVFVSIPQVDALLGVLFNSHSNVLRIRRG